MERVEIAPEQTGLTCEKCGGPMIVRFGRYGKFIACSNYPECRNTKAHVVKTGAKCPECGGDLLQRRTRRRRVFYGCSNYPDCKFAVWKRPLPEPCPSCGGLLIEAGRDKTKCHQCQEVFERGAETEGTD